MPEVFVYFLSQEAEKNNRRELRENFDISVRIPHFLNYATRKNNPLVTRVIVEIPRHYFLDEDEKVYHLCQQV